MYKNWWYLLCVLACLPGCSVYHRWADEKVGYVTCRRSDPLRQERSRYLRSCTLYDSGRTLAHFAAVWYTPSFYDVVEQCAGPHATWHLAPLRTYVDETHIYIMTDNDLHAWHLTLHDDYGDSHAPRTVERSCLYQFIKLAFGDTITWFKRPVFHVVFDVAAGEAPSLSLTDGRSTCCMQFDGGSHEGA